MAIQRVSLAQRGYGKSIMRTIRSRVSINAKPEDVFRVLVDFNTYDQWNPWLRGVKGQAREGEQVVVRPNIISLLGLRLHYRLTKIQAPDFLRWEEEAWFHPLFYTVREYQIFTKASGGAIYSVGLRFQGPLANIVGLFYGKVVWRGLNKEAQALKHYCETKFT